MYTNWYGGIRQRLEKTWSGEKAVNAGSKNLKFPQSDREKKGRNKIILRNDPVYLN